MGNVFDDIRERSEARGKEIGKEIGRVKGDHDARVDVALRMIHKGEVIFEDIADLTGLPIEEVNDLANKENA